MWARKGDEKDTIELHNSDCDWQVVSRNEAIELALDILKIALQER